MDWPQLKTITSEDDNSYTSPTYTVPGSWVHVHYYEAYNILFRFENALRVLVYSVLKRHKFSDWVNTNVSGDESIGNVVKKRIAQSNKYGYLGQSSNSPMLFLNMGELISILENESLWTYFGRYFSADRSVVVNKLLEINTVRNSFAHFRPVTVEDISLLKQNISHVFHKTIDYFDDLYSLDDPVPANCNEGWYSLLSAYSNPYSDLSFYQSSSEEFVKIKFFIPMLVLRSSLSENRADIVVAKTNVAKLLKLNKKLLTYVIYVNDSRACGGNIVGHAKPLTPYSGVNLHFVLSRSTLSKKASEIFELFSELGTQISNDIEVLQGNDKSSGKFTIATRLYGFTKVSNNEARYDFGPQHDPNAEQKSELVEYWGETMLTLGLLKGESVTERSTLPWVSGQICPVSSGF